MNILPSVSERSLRVVAYSGGLDVPSARFRVRQYVEAMTQFRIELRESASRAGQYPPTARWLRPAWLLAAWLERGFQVAIRTVMTR